MKTICHLASETSCVPPCQGLLWKLGEEGGFVCNLHLQPEQASAPRPLSGLSMCCSHMALPWWPDNTLVTHKNLSSSSPRAPLPTLPLAPCFMTSVCILFSHLFGFPFLLLDNEPLRTVSAFYCAPSSLRCPCWHHYLHQLKPAPHWLAKHPDFLSKCLTTVAVSVHVRKGLSCLERLDTETCVCSKVSHLSISAVYSIPKILY